MGRDVSEIRRSHRSDCQRRGAGIERDNSKFPVAGRRPLEGPLRQGEVRGCPQKKGAEGMLTEDMTRLCDEIVTMRKARGSMMNELRHDAKGLKHTVKKLCAHLGQIGRASCRERV